MSSNKSVDSQPVIACNLNAIQTEQRGQHLTTTRQMLGTVLAVHELETGYELRLPAETPMLYKVAEYIANERLCCPFFRFEMIVEPSGDVLWLRLTGGEGVKDFLAAELGEVIGLSHHE